MGRTLFWSAVMMGLALVGCGVMEPMVVESRPRPARPKPARPRAQFVPAEFTWDPSTPQTRAFPSIDVTCVYAPADGSNLGKLGITLHNHSDRVISPANMAIRLSYNGKDIEIQKVDLSFRVLPGKSGTVSIDPAKELGRDAGALSEPTVDTATFSVFDVPVVVDALGRVTKLENLAWRFKFVPGTNRESSGAEADVSGPVQRGAGKPRDQRRDGDDPSGWRNAKDPGSAVDICNALCSRAATFYQESESAQKSRVKICMQKCITDSRVDFRRCVSHASDRLALLDCEGL